MAEDNLNEWMSDIKYNKALPNGRGVVKAIKHPEPKKTRFGDRKICEVVIEGSDNSVISVALFLPPQFPFVNSKSNLAKILQHYGCNELIQLIGKTVEVEQVGDMLWKIKAE